MTDIDTKELRRLMEAKRAADREYSAAWGNLNAFTQEEISGITARMFEAWGEFSRSAIEALPALLSEAEEAKRLREELAALRAALAAERAAREKAEAQLAERGKPFIAAAEEAYWLLAWTWQSHLTGPGKPFDMSIFAPEARNMMTKAEQDLFDALSEIQP